MYTKEATMQGPEVIAIGNLDILCGYLRTNE
jgi:hypothetical protein